MWPFNRKGLGQVQFIALVNHITGTATIEHRGTARLIQILENNLMAKIKDVKDVLTADIEAVRTDLVKIADGVAAQNKMISDLQQRVANGGEVSDAEIAPLLAAGETLKAAADTLAASLAPPNTGDGSGTANT